jgi:hypothetical protein
MNSPTEPALARRARLRPHPAGGESPVTSIEVSLRRSPAAVLAVTYRIHGDLASVRTPQPRAPRVVEGLWQHTCCELFLRVERTGAYHELNLSPSGEWAAYVFDRYREGRLLTDEALDPQVRSSTGSAVLELSATVALAGLSRSYAQARLALAVSTVIEARDGSRSYWALAHPAPEPDFHHPDAFALAIDAVRN